MSASPKRGITSQRTPFYDGQRNRCCREYWTYEHLIASTAGLSHNSAFSSATAANSHAERPHTKLTRANTLPTSRAFGTMFAFGGDIYFINGDPNSSIPPNNQGVGDQSVYYASALRGAVGTWVQDGNSTIHDRAKGLLFNAYGQVIAGEGTYNGSVGSGEMETSTINANNTTNNALNSWNGLTGFFGAERQCIQRRWITSPLVSPTNAPRFLILGGQAPTGTTGTGGALSSTVYYNNEP